MKSRLAVLVAFLGLVVFTSVARADVFSVSADLPLTFDPKFTITGSPALRPKAPVSGFKLGVSLPFLIGLGMESYTAKLDRKTFDPSGTAIVSDIDYKVTMYDLFFNLPFPIVNIALGLGVGSAAFGTPINADLKDAALMQYWASLGIPFGLLDVHLGMHQISGSHKSKTAGGGEAKVEASMISLGVKIGY